MKKSEKPGAFLACATTDQQYLSPVLLSLSHFIGIWFHGWVNLRFFQVL